MNCDYTILRDLLQVDVYFKYVIIFTNELWTQCVIRGKLSFPQCHILMEDFMKKILTAAAACLAALLLFSCGSEPTSASIQAEKDGVPVWVYEGKKDKNGLYAVGAGKLSNDINSRKMAVAQARLELAQSVEVSVKGITQTFVDDQGADGDRQFLSAMTENAALATESVLNGTEQADLYKAKDGTIYVLMFLPKNTFVTELTKKASAFERTSSAEFTEQKMAEAYDKYFSNFN